MHFNDAYSQDLTAALVVAVVAAAVAVAAAFGDRWTVGEPAEVEV